MAVIDTGVDVTHWDLQQSIWRNTDEIAGDQIDNDGNGFVDDIYGWNFADNNHDVQDNNGHGTHVAGTIVAARNNRGPTGLAYDASVMPIRVLSDDGRGTSWAVAAGIRYAVDNGADIINMSLSGGYSSAIYAAAQYAAEQGVFIVAAAGNEDAATPSHPAAESSQLPIISVGAFDSTQMMASFSNRVGASGAVQIDAPGVRIVSTLPAGRIGSYSGTSMAAPHVSAVAALTLSASPKLTPDELRDLLTGGATGQVRGSDSIGSLDAAITVGYAAAGIPIGSYIASQQTGSAAESNAGVRAAGVQLDEIATPTKLHQPWVAAHQSMPVSAVKVMDLTSSHQKTRHRTYPSKCDRR